MTLAVNGLTIELAGRRLVDDLSFDVAPGQRLGLIGESGSGKSLTLLALLGLTPPGARLSGSIVFDGRELLGSRDRERARIRGAEIGMVFQDPRTALNPIRTAGGQIAEPLRIHEGATRDQARKRALEAIAEVGLPDPARFAELYPHQLSGGQRQRVGIAMALICRPALLLADEPTTALDVTTQSEILALFRRLVDERGSALVFVTHDLAVLAQIARDALVLADGRAIERGPVAEILQAPVEPITRALVAAARATTWRAS